ncbi:MAG: DUF45 domain-containing protein [Chlorobiales bacterium]|nr:DUF45 domain-containing protein [Chlorobiales bacterium]
MVTVTTVNLGDIAVDVVMKDIKNIHLSVYPPFGKVRVSAPLRMNIDTIRIFAISKLGWIKKQQQKLQAQERESPREYLNRESHYLWGKRYLLHLLEPTHNNHFLTLISQAMPKWQFYRDELNKLPVTHEKWSY